MPESRTGGPLGWVDGRLVPMSEMAVPAWDLGFMQGVAVAAQLRTVHGAVWALPAHLERLAEGLYEARLKPQFTLERIGGAIMQVAALNHALLDSGDDLTIHVSVTGGDGRAASPALWEGSAAATGECRVLVSATPLDFGRWRATLDRGLELATSRVCELPAESSPRSLKSRSRMHYWLAAAEADRSFPGASPLLPGCDGMVADTGHGTVVLVGPTGRDLVLPRADQILRSVTATQLLPVLEEAGFRITRRDITPEELKRAEELLWFSTALFALPVGRLDGIRMGGWQGAAWAAVQRMLSEHLKLDPWDQARRYAERKRVPPDR